MRCPSLREVINYHAFDDAWVPDMLAGLTMDEAGAAKFDGDLLGNDPAASLRGRSSRHACAAADQVGADDLDAHGPPVLRRLHRAASTSGRSTCSAPCGRTTWPLVIGVAPSLPPQLVQGVWDEVSPNAEEWRSIGVFPAAVPVPDHAPILDRLLGLTGRQPSGG